MPDNNERLLVVLIGTRRAAAVTMDAAGRFTLTYDEGWRSTRNATPLSLSMPLTQAVHDDPPVRAFLWGLLPDNERVLDRWAQTYQVSPRNPFALLRHVGEDCAGAAQFVIPERVDTFLAGDGGVRWMDDDEVAERLRELRRDPSAWHVHNTGQFSLAGTQAKTALHYDPEAERWGEPWGAVPTTHILKPAVVGLDDHDLNEHLCLRAATELGLVVANSRVVSFGSERVIVVERYDMYAPRLKMAMKIGGEYGLEAVAERHWRRFAAANGIVVDEMMARLDGLVERIPQAFAAAEKTAPVEGLASALPARIVERVAARAMRCRESLKR